MYSVFLNKNGKLECLTIPNENKEEVEKTKQLFEDKFKFKNLEIKKLKIIE